jgi:hypothetical protein
VCRRRRCCRQDRPDFPSFGDWLEPIHGALGVLATDEDGKVICHVCGAAYAALEQHALRRHGLWPEEYRVLFGLERQRALESPALRARRRALADEQLRPWRARIREVASRATTVQRVARSQGKTRRLETLQDPENRAHWREGGPRARQTRRARIAAGHRELPQGFQAGSAAVREVSARGRARRDELLQDPGYRAAFRQRLSEAKGGRESTTCEVCGRTFEVPPSWLRAGYGKHCSAACHEQWKLQRGRSRDGLPWQQVAERVRRLGSALDVLKPPGPEIVRLFYGLVDGTPWTQRAIAEHLCLTTRRVQHVLHGQDLARLLGDRPRRTDREVVNVACAVCGRAVQREPRELRDRAQTTCGPACRRELRRRQLAARPPLDASVRARAGEAFRRKLALPEFRARWEANQQAARNRRRSAAADKARGPDEALPNTGSNVGESGRATHSAGAVNLSGAALEDGVRTGAGPTG